jgi:two-component system, LuxR family, response regulator FixJ
MMQTMAGIKNNNALESRSAPRSTVVLVDDSSAIRESTRVLLKTVGLEVVPYANPTNFLEELPEANCILLDVRMPEMSGLEVYKRLREAGVNTPVIFITGHGHVSMAVGAMREGAFDFLEKPVDDQRLIDAIFAAIAKDSENRRNAGSRAETAQRLARLTPRELDIARLISDGHSSREVAEKLDLSVRTVEGYRSRILNKLEADSLAHMIRMLQDADR